MPRILVLHCWQLALPEIPPCFPSVFGVRLIVIFLAFSDGVPTSANKPETSYLVHGWGLVTTDVSNKIMWIDRCSLLLLLLAIAEGHHVFALLVLDSLLHEVRIPILATAGYRAWRFCMYCFIRPLGVGLGGSREGEA